MPSGSKITQLISASALQAYDIFPFVSGSPTTPVTKYIRADDLFENIPSDVNSVPLTDYSGISTIVGWSSFTTKILTYKKVGNLVFVLFRIEGTSGSSTTTVSLPYAISGVLDVFNLMYAVDNGVGDIGKIQVTGSTLYLSPSVGSTYTGWTSSGTKSVRGEFFYFASS